MVDSTSKPLTTDHLSMVSPWNPWNSRTHVTRVLSSTDGANRRAPEVTPQGTILGLRYPIYALPDPPPIVRTSGKPVMLEYNTLRRAGDGLAENPRVGSRHGGV